MGFKQVFDNLTVKHMDCFEEADSISHQFCFEPLFLDLCNVPMLRNFENDRTQ